MGRYDITLGHLTRIGCRAFLQTIGGEGRLTVLETDFPTARERRVDHLAVIDAPDGSRTLLHVEFQATVDARMPKRMLGYYSDILNWVAEHPQDRVGPLPDEVTQKVVYVGAGEWQSGTAICHQNLNFRFELVEASKLRAKPLLETGDLGDAVVAVLTADGTSTDVIKAILGKIMRAPASERADALAQLVALSQLRGIRPLIEQEYNAMSIVVSVEDSAILRPPIDRAYDLGMAKGKAEGKAEGQALGQAAGMAKSIETILHQRFPGQVPSGLADRLSHVAAETLDEILHKSLTAASVAEALGPDQPANGSRPKA